MELKQQQEELAGILFSIDKILKRNLHIQTKLSKELQKHLMENISSTININLFNNIIKLQTEGKTKEEIINSLKPLKANFARQIRSFNNQLRMANDIEMTDKKYSLEEINEFETDYSLLIRTSHPLVVVSTDQINVTTFNMLRQFFMINNIDGFKKLQEEHPIVNYEIRDVEAASKQLEKTINVYKEQLNKLETVDDAKFKKMEEIINDETLLAREETALRQQNYKLKEQLNSLKKKMTELYPDGYTDLLK